MKHRSMLILLLTISSIIAGCGSSPAATAPAQPPAASAMPQPTTAAAPAATVASAPTSASAAPVTLSVFALEQPGVDLATNSFSKAMEQQFNIRFKWQTAPFDEVTSTQKRQLSLASGAYPDVYMLYPWGDTFSKPELLQYAKQGVIVPLNDLIVQYAPHIQAALAQYPDLKALATAPDGKIYGLPQFNECYHCSYPNKLWINTAWLNKLGLAAPTTTEEFKAVLEAFKTRDPNGNGKADEIPLSGSTEDFGVHVVPFLMNSFIYDDDRTYLVMNNGAVTLAANKPEWKAGLSYIKSLYDAGLIDPNAFTQNRDGLNKLGSNPDVMVLGAATTIHPAVFVPRASPASKNYDVLPPLHGPQVSYATYRYAGQPGASFVLTNKASPAAQVAAIKMLDYLFTTDGQLRGYFGEEDKDWHKPQPGDVALNPAVTPLYVNTSALNTGERLANRAWGPLAQYYNPRAYRDAEVQATAIYTSEGYERRLQQATTLYDGKQPKTVFPFWAIWTDPVQADETAKLRTSINEYVDQNALLFITGAKDLDKDWDAYVAGLDQLQLKRYLVLMQQAYNRSAKP